MRLPGELSVKLLGCSLTCGGGAAAADTAIGGGFGTVEVALTTCATEVLTATAANGLCILKG